MNLKLLNPLNITSKFFNQGQNNRNRVALKALKKLGFSMPKIRKALIELNGLNIIILANSKVSGPTFYNTIRGDKNNLKSQKILADTLKVDREELFSDAC